jgi:hypothetical protein
MNQPFYMGQEVIVIGIDLYYGIIKGEFAGEKGPFLQVLIGHYDSLQLYPIPANHPELYSLD